jgi:hypothetical protein
MPASILRFKVIRVQLGASYLISLIAKASCAGNATTKVDFAFLTISLIHMGCGDKGRH